MLNPSRIERFGSIWKELEPVEVPKEKLETLFSVKTVEVKAEVSKCNFGPRNFQIVFVCRALIRKRRRKN